ncbi:MAG: hypothetical protein OHK0013_40630 [Sandaracinaceae bacterium]
MTVPSARAASPRTIVLAWLPAGLYMTTIWVVSSLETPTFPTDAFPLRDKGVHFVEYGVLGFLLAHACLRTFLRHARVRVAAFAVLFGVLWGLFDEIHQAFVPGRSADALDLVADALGVVVGTLVRLGVGRLRAFHTRSLGGSAA